MKTENSNRQRKQREPDYEARLKQIGEILAEGVAMVLAEKRDAKVRQDHAAFSDPEITPVQVAEITNREAEVLHLLRRQGKLRPCEIRDYLGCSRATVSRVTDRLRQSGLIRREGLTSATTFALTCEGENAAKYISSSS